jgi:hypothetical protein
MVVKKAKEAENKKQEVDCKKHEPQKRKEDTEEPTVCHTI